MGLCCSKDVISSTPTPLEVKIQRNPEQPEKKKDAAVAVVATATDQQVLKKEVVVIKHRKSNEIDRHPDQETRKSTDRKRTPSSGTNSDVTQSTVVSNGESGKPVGATVRTSSCTKEEVEAILIQCGRLSRSSSGVKPAGAETPTRGRRYSGSKRSFDFDMEMGSKNDDEEAVAADGDHHRRRHARASSPSSRRRSRERDPQQQRSGSKERGSGGGRRVSRSPNRRSESPNPISNGTVAAAAGGNSSRPAKLVSVPATDKSNNAGGGELVAGGVKRIQVKRNSGESVAVAGSRTAASPRSRSPARANLRVLNENQNQQPLTLSRSNSKKAEHSPYRRNPLAEIDTNKPNGGKTMNNKTKEPQVIDEAKTALDNPKHNQIVTRSRSSRLSQDLDINPENLLNPNPTSYATLLLEDIHNFHQKNPPTTTTTVAAASTAPPAFTLPACVSKACSILEAVADLNSNDRQFKKDKKDDLVESEMVVNDDLMEPSLHKYVTVRRGCDAETEEQESSGSNSFAGSQQLNWMSSSWEPNSADSTNCWTSSSTSSGRDTELQRSREYTRNGIGRGRVGDVHGRSAYSLPNNATVAST